MNIKFLDNFSSKYSSSFLERVSAFILLSYLCVYFLIPYKPWGLPISLHTPLLGIGLLICFVQVGQNIRSNNFVFTYDLILFILALVLFLISSLGIHFADFSRQIVQSYALSFCCLLFVRMVIKKLNLNVLFFLMQIYLIVSGILILLQINFAGSFYVAGLLGQNSPGNDAAGMGFASSHIFAGGSVAWMISIVMTNHIISSKKKLNVCNELLYLCSIGFGFTALFYSFNRGAWLAIGLGLLFFWGILLYYKGYQKQLFKSLIVAFVFVSFFQIVTNPNINRMEGNISFAKNIIKTPKDAVLNDASSLTRLKAWALALDAIKKYPVWGIGPGQYPKLYKQSFSDLYKGLASDRFDPNPRQTASNSYLYYAVEIGMLPAFFLFFFIISVFINGFKRGITSEEYPFFIGGIVICLWVVTSDYIGERIFWIALASVAGFDSKNKIKFNLKSIKEKIFRVKK